MNLDELMADIEAQTHTTSKKHGKSKVTSSKPSTSSLKSSLAPVSLPPKLKKVITEHDQWQWGHQVDVIVFWL